MSNMVAKMDEGLTSSFDILRFKMFLQSWLVTRPLCQADRFELYPAESHQLLGWALS